MATGHCIPQLALNYASTPQLSMGLMRSVNVGAARRLQTQVRSVLCANGKQAQPGLFRSAAWG